MSKRLLWRKARIYFASVFVFGVIFGTVGISDLSWLTRPDGPAAEANAENDSSPKDNAGVKAEERTAEYTLWLAVGTFLLALGALLQIVFLRRTDATAAHAADAARKSAEIAERALTELERPYVYVDVIDATGESNDGYPLAQQGIVGIYRVEVHNFGRTPANLTRIAYDADLSPWDGIVPPVDPAKVGGAELPVGVVAVADRPYSETVGTDITVIQMDHNESCWVSGFVRYRDIFGKNHITGFARVFHPRSGKFSAVGGPDHNYSRTENAEDIPTPSSKQRAIHLVVALQAAPPTHVVPQ
jgi:hypothetical protein